MDHVHPVRAGMPDGFVQVMLATVHAPQPPGGEFQLLLIVPVVGQHDVRVGNMHDIERLGSADLYGYLLDIK